jgi:hypothetical protein
MTSKISFLLLFIFFADLFPLPDNVLIISKVTQNEFHINVDYQSHLDYGFSFPLTYCFSLSEIKNITVLKKYSANQEWEMLDAAEIDYYNHHELFRIDSSNNRIYISLGFSSQTDTLFIKVISNDNSSVEMDFVEITKYYDNRDAAVIASADDMAGWSQEKFETTIGIFLGYRLYLTLGMNTAGMSNNTYDFVQKYLDTGFIEAGAHSRTHPNWGEYGDYDSEITGCKNDIINNLDLPDLYRNGDNEYVYTYIAPHGYFDDIIDSLIGQNKMLVNRLYHNDFFDDFSEWNSKSGTYFPFTVTRSFDPPSSELGWGIGTNDINDLNGKFDEVIDKGGVYHLMCHPNVMQWYKDYTLGHLDHISNKSNIWYSTLGHLYVYHLAQTNYVYNNLVKVAKNEVLPKGINLHQNYPNPFNPRTTIRYSFPPEVNSESSIVNIKVFDVLGREVATLINEKQNPGEYEVTWDPSSDGLKLTSGIYFYTLEIGINRQTKKMIYMK